MSIPHRRARPALPNVRLCALACSLWLASCDATTEQPANPYNEAEVGRWAMALAQLPDGSLVVGSSSITSEGKVQRVEGGEATLMFDHTASYLEVGGGFLYFGERNEAHHPVLGRQPLEGGEVEWLAANADIAGLASDDEHVYWLESDPWGVRRLAHAGGEVELVQETPEAWGQLAVDETHLYWITLQGLSRAPKQGGVEEKILEPDDFKRYLDRAPASFALSDQHVFMASGVGYVGSRGALLRMNKDGSELTLLAGDQNAAYGATVDAEYVYWVRGQTNEAVEYPGFQEILRMPLDGGEIEPIANRQNGVTDLLPTHDGLYWTCRNERFLDFAPLN